MKLSIGAQTVTQFFTLKYWLVKLLTSYAVSNELCFILKDGDPVEVGEIYQDDNDPHIIVVSLTHYGNV
jgi:hypothetical protein